MEADDRDNRNSSIISYYEGFLHWIAMQDKEMGSVMYFISYMAPFCDLVRTKMQIFCGLFMVHPHVDKTQHCQATALAVRAQCTIHLYDVTWLTQRTSLTLLVSGPYSITKVGLIQSYLYLELWDLKKCTKQHLIGDFLRTFLGATFDSYVVGCHLQKITMDLFQLW